MTAPLRKNGILVVKLVRMCESKNRYPDEYVARGVGQEMSMRKKIDLYVYQCPHCRGWHLTKHPQSDRRRSVDYDFKENPK